MIAVNGVTARYLASKKVTSLRRIVRTPIRWDRTIEIANRCAFSLDELRYHYPQEVAVPL